MKIIHSILVFIVLLSIIACDKAIKTDQKNHILWYNSPASDWNNALPLGNGKIGVMVFGNPINERIQLNDDSMWPGENNWDNPDGNKKDLDKIRELLFKGENAKADDLFVEKFSRKGVGRSHQTLGDLFIDFSHSNISNYKRELDISKAISSISYKSDGALVSEKVFVSHPHNVIVIEFSSEAKNGLNGKVKLTRPTDEGIATAITKTTEDKLLIMNGEVTQRGAVFESKPDPILNGVKFETCLRINNQDGEVLAGDDYLELRNVSKATFYIVSNSSYYFNNYQAQNKSDLAALLNISLREIEDAHIKDYQEFYNRVSLHLINDNLDSIPTNQRIERIKQGETDLGLEAMLFNFGRYLLIASSREGTNPANLQGLWNEHMWAPWNGDYHMNINLQMNYWLADVTNLSELNNPLFDYTDKLIENGKVTAEKNFGCRGSFIPHASDLWAPTFLRAPTAYWGCSMGAGGWMAQHYWEHFAFSRDTFFLQERAFPVLEQVAKFYSDWIIEDPRDGSLVSAPSTSPENRFINAKGQPVASCLGSAMDQQVIAEVFDNYMHACRVLNIENKFLQTVKTQRAKLRNGMVIGDDGRILEWDRPYKETEAGHRHISHLYAFHPGTGITISKNPEIFEAAKKTLNYRLENGGAGTGWSRAWLINCSARLMDGEMAHEHIQLLIQKSLSNNLFDMHPPFQIDGNFGYTAGIAEMLLQSHEKNIIRILPALPTQWKTGSIKGLKARGNITVNIYWENGELQEINLICPYNTQLKLIYKDISKDIKLTKNEVYTFKK